MLWNVARLLLEGLHEREIADELGTQVGYVKNAKKEWFWMTGTETQEGLAVWIHAHRKEVGVPCACDDHEVDPNIFGEWLKQPIKFPAPSRRRREDREIPKAA
jgi:hypothetical protein